SQANSTEDRSEGANGLRNRKEAGRLPRAATATPARSEPLLGVWGPYRGPHLSGLPGVAHRALQIVLLERLRHPVEIDAVELGDGRNPGALAAMEELRAALGHERLAVLGRRLL